MFNRFLDPKNDFAFKKIFGQEKNKDILIHFLNDVLDHTTMGIIQDVSFIDLQLAPEIEARKQSFVDILCTDEKGSRFIVEMQVARQDHFVKRAQFYAAKAYGSQMRKGGKYEDLKEIVFLAITDFVLFPDKPEYKTTHGIFDRKTWTQDLKDFHFTFLELPKFTKGFLDLETLEDKWCYFFKHAIDTKGTEYEALSAQMPILKRAFDALVESSWSDAELAVYEDAEKRRMDEEGRLSSALRQGIQQGIEKGIAQGIEKGIEKGIEQEKLSVAKNMLEIGLPLDTIRKATGLTLEQIQELKS
jgi:predicted transposase/invertase (TIGR01784 family)